MSRPVLVDHRSVPSPPPGVLPRLMSGVERTAARGRPPMSNLDHHLAVHGPLPERQAEEIIVAIDRAGLRGRGGAAFPTARKLRAVAAPRRPKVVVANGTEGEPASKKDQALMREAPHLVLEGAALAARAVGAKEAVIALSQSDQRAASSLAQALEQRHAAARRDEPRWTLVRSPVGFLSGQESALVHYLNGGPVVPTFGPRPFERGVRGRPTLVQNVETLAHMALIARHGADWFRGLGTAAHPGSTLLTVSGAVERPGVYEVELGMPLVDLLSLTGIGEPLSAVLVGGYFGTWLPASALSGVRLAADTLAAHRSALGAGVILALPESACPVAETARVAEFLDAESAGQCGPCLNGLAAISTTLARVAAGASQADDLRHLERWTSELPGRGACQHPDGASRFVSSALRVFASEFLDHAHRGPCPRCVRPSVLPVPRPAALAA